MRKLVVAASGLAFFASAVLALEAKRERGDLERLEFFEPQLTISTANVRDETGQLRRAKAEAWDRLASRYPAGFEVYFDPRSGSPSNLLGRVPLLPGRGAGNGITLDLVAERLGRATQRVDHRAVGDLVRGFIVEAKEALGIDPDQLGPPRATKVADHLWQVSLPQVVDGIPVRRGRILATINHGNLVLLGTETWGDVAIDTRPSITAEQALAAGFAFAGGRGAEDELWSKPRLEIVPFAPPEHQDGEAFAGPVGQGYGHLLVWAFGFVRPPELARWELLVDAHSAKVIAFQDTNHYETERISGGVYPLTSTEICPTDESCGTMQPDYPMPHADTGLPAPDDFTNAAGLFEHSGGTVTTTLDGRFVRVNDNCGALTESADGSVDLGGVNGEHDCVSAGSSPGDTPAARSCFYETNKLIEMARGWLPGNSWLQGQLTANVNINLTCNAFYSPSAGTVNFYRSGGGCRNTGEIAAVFDHEWGHALDDNDAGGSLSSSSEAYADIAAIYRLQSSCVGYGFIATTDDGCGQTADGTGFNQNESQTGSHCDTDCSGVRDADWARHADGIPDTPENFSCVHCGSGSGPCGRQVHCAAAPSRQAAWDLVTRDLRAAPFGYDSNSAFIVGNRLFYQGSGNIGSWHACTCPASSNGCGAANAYMQWIAADDDNGDLADGTPHMTAIHAAFDRHGIACDTPAPTDSGCAGAPTDAPALVLAVGSNQLELGWTAVAGATTYRVFRTEGHAGCNFGKALIATVAGTGYTDSEVANGRDYGYVVQAVGASDACFGPASVCATAAPQPCAGSIGLDRVVYNCMDTVSITLVDSDLIGAGSHDVEIRSSTEPTPESLTLSESPPGSGRFLGAFATTSGAPVSGDGAVSVTDGDSIHVTYLDASSCGTPDVTVERTRPVDCSGPVISDVQAANVTGNSAEILWSTDEAADSRVAYDTAAPPAAGLVESPELETSHLLRLQGLAECSLHYFSVASTDGAGNGATDDNAGAFYTFETGRNVQPDYLADDTPVSIPDNDPAGARSTLVVTDDKTIVDVDVTVDVTHTYDGDLTLRLIGPDGTEVVLSNRRGGSGNDFDGTRFDDEAAAPISAGSAPFAGAFRPDEPLSGFDGKNAQGSWSFEVVDQAGIDVGTIDAFTLHLTYPAQECGPSIEVGSHTLTDACGGSGSGGGNGIVESGEDVLLPVTLRNNGTDPTTGVVARLHTSTPGVTIARDTASYPDLGAGESAASTSAPFAFSLSTAAGCGTTIDFTLEATADQGGWSDAFSILVGTPGSAIATHDSTDVPRPILDNTTFTSVLSVTETFVVTDVDVEITLTHTYDGDLDIFLIGPAGTRVELTTDNGGTGENFTATIFDDEAPTPITSGSAPFTGRFRPEGSLAALDGVAASGTWTLEVTDDAGADTGELVAWSIVLSTTAPPACDACSVDPPLLAPELAWTSPSRAEWAATPGAGFYKLYRGEPADLPALLGPAPDSCLRATTLELDTGETLDETPAAEAYHWYLLRAGNAGGEGPAGDATAGPRQVDSTGPCP